MVIGGYLGYVAMNFKQLYNEYGRMGYINLTDKQENLTIVQGAWGRCQGAHRIYQDGQGCSKDGQRLFRSAFVLLLWHVTTDLRQTMEGYGWSGKHSRMR